MVISGNAGGLNADGSIKGEFHIEANGVDNHVSDIETYGPITSCPSSGLTNSRIVTGIAKNGVLVELRLWDGGEPEGHRPRLRETQWGRTLSEWGVSVYRPGQHAVPPEPPWPG